MATVNFIHIPPHPDFPGNDIVEIYLESYSSLKDGKITLIPTSVSALDVDNGIDALIQHLNHVRKKAKAKFKR